MDTPTPLVMFGAGGRMGCMILSLAAGQPDRFQIVGAVERSDHPHIGQPLAQFIPGGPASVALCPAPPAAAPTGAVGIHFSLPEGTLAHLEWSRRGGFPALIGTTGFSAEQKKQVEALAATAPVLLTPNTSLGVSVLFWLVEKAARLLGEAYDVEIVEMHHHHKKDSPSGTARRLAEVVLAVTGGDYEKDIRHGRHGLVGARSSREVGMHALRGGDVTGEHTVVFAGPAERIELTHRAHSREVFAQGALRAAAWLHTRRPGLYTMNDVLGL